MSGAMNSRKTNIDDLEISPEEADRSTLDEIPIEKEKSESETPAKTISRNSSLVGISMYGDLRMMLNAIESTTTAFDLTKLWQNMNRMIDKKCSLIAQLMSDRQNAVEQYEQSAWTHNNLLAPFIDIYKLFAESFQEDSRNKTNAMISNMHMNCCMYKQIISEHHINFQNILHAINAMTMNVIERDTYLFECNKMDLNVEQLAKKETYNILMTENFKTMTVQMQAENEKLDNVAKKKHSLINEPEIFDHADKSEAIARSVDRQLMKKKRILSRLERLLETQEAEHDRKLVRWMESKQSYVNLLSSTKDAIQKETFENSRKIKCLSTEAFKVIEDLKKYDKYCKGLFTSLKMCRKMQTENDLLINYLPGASDVACCPNELHRFWYLLATTKSEILTLRGSVKNQQTENEANKNLVRIYSRNHRSAKHENM